MRIVVTGGAGFLGSHLLDALITGGHSVIALDNLSTGCIDNLEHLTSHEDFCFIRSDVCDHLDISDPLDAVLHFASPASPPDYLNAPLDTLKVNSIGTLNALALAKAKHARFLLASTSEIYGDPLIHPQSESYWGNVSSIGPRSVYDEGKRFAEAATMAYHRLHGVDTRIVRIFNTYGPRMRPNDGRVVSNFLVQALNDEPLTVYGDGSQTRSFCYVEDLIRGILLLLVAESDKDRNTLSNGHAQVDSEMSTQDSIHAPINLGNPQTFTVLEIAQYVREFVGANSPIVHRALPVHDPKRRRPDIGRARRILNWSPTIELEEGIRRTMYYFQQRLRTQDSLTNALSSSGTD
jgi:dTDP-glucose 4,6-dehydratase